MEEQRCKGIIQEFFKHGKWTLVKKTKSSDIYTCEGYTIRIWHIEGLGDDGGTYYQCVIDTNGNPYLLDVTMGKERGEMLFEPRKGVSYWPWELDIMEETARAAKSLVAQLDEHMGEIFPGWGKAGE